MNILLVLIPISLILLGFAVWALVWAVRKGQFDDLDTPALAVLADDDLHTAKHSGERGNDRAVIPVEADVPADPSRDD